MKCLYCGKALSENDQFCRYCGKKINPQNKKRKKLLIGLIILLIICLAVVFVMQSGLMVRFSGEADKTVGNTCGNLRNGGCLAQQGEWVYYSKGRELCKAKDIGKEERVLCMTDPQSNINVVGDWVYFSTSDSYGENGKIYKIRTDGTDETELLSLENECWLLNMIVYEDTIFYQVCDKEDSYSWTGGQTQYPPGECFIMKTDGTDQKSFLGSDCSLVGIENEWVYYVKWNSEVEMAIMRQSLNDSTEAKTIYESDIVEESRYIKVPITQIVVKDGWVYCGLIDAIITNETKKIAYTISRIRAESGEIQQLCDVETEGWGAYVLPLNITGEWVYWIDRKGGGDDEDSRYDILKVDINGKEKTGIKISEEEKGQYAYLYTTDQGVYKAEYISEDEDGDGFEDYIYPAWTKID